MTDLLPGPVPDETRSTCLDCAMCGADSLITFELKTKCCTYIPVIPNFLAGKIIEAEIPVFDAYFPHADVRPHGVLPHQDFLDQYYPNSPLFGRNLKWRCPYYVEAEGGLCGIWQSRNARCATWFCKHLHGQISRNFWTSIEELLTAVEKNLSHWCIQKLEVGSCEFRDAFPVTTEQPGLDLWMKQQSYYQKRLLYGDDAPADFQRWTWGTWIGREKDFFIACYKLIRPLSWKDVQTICGASLQNLEQNTLTSYAKLTSDFFPDVLRLSDFHQAEVNEKEVRIWTSNPYDPITLSKDMLRLLHRMSGRKMAEVRKEILGELLQKLFDAGVLI
ncbi:hypothetical protein L0156_03165 [bacterium]|nr:hypothetical protein [bacterium]